MEGFDAEKAARVWQRVQGGQTAGAAPVRDGPAELLHQSHALAGLYLGLQRRLPGKTAGRIRELYHRHRELMACLKGICLATGGAAPGLPPMEAGSGTVHGILTGCFHRERRLGEGLAALAAQRELGQVCALLAGQAAQRELTVLEVLGECREN